MHYALCAHRFGKTLAELDAQPWPEVGSTIRLLIAKAEIDSGG